MDRIWYVHACMHTQMGRNAITRLKWCCQDHYSLFICCKGGKNAQLALVLGQFLLLLTIYLDCLPIPTHFPYSIRVVESGV